MSVSIRLFKVDKKAWTVYELLNLKMYGVLLDIMGLYRKRFGDSWS